MLQSHLALEEDNREERARNFAETSWTCLVAALVVAGHGRMALDSGLLALVTKLTRRRRQAGLSDARYLEPHLSILTLHSTSGASASELSALVDEGMLESLALSMCARTSLGQPPSPELGASAVCASLLTPLRRGGLRDGRPTNAAALWPTQHLEGDLACDGSRARRHPRAARCRRPQAGQRGSVGRDVRQDSGDDRTKQQARRVLVDGAGLATQRRMARIEMLRAELRCRRRSFPLRPLRDRPLLLQTLPKVRARCMPTND